MKVQIKLTSISGYIPKYWSDRMQLHNLKKDITQNALKAWHNRKEGETRIRFLQAMPATHGAHFRFLTVTQQDETTLLVSVD